MNLLDLAEAARAAAVLLESSKKTGLHHPRHQKVLKVAKRKIQGILSNYFDMQGAAVLRAVKPRIRQTLEVIRPLTEARSPKAKRFADTLVPDSLSPLRFPITAGESNEFAIAIQAAIIGAGKVLAKELKKGKTLAPDVAEKYLRENSLTKLTGDFAETSVERLRGAVADAWEQGGSFDQIVKAVQDTFSDFSSTRAEMIAQTEGNAAYNAGRMAMADALGMTEKAWETESGNPCDICLDNEYQEFIGIDEEFASGDDGPTAHPNCQCTLIFRQTDGPEE